MKRFNKLRVSINFAGNQCLAVTKQWLPNTNFDNPANWNKGRVPCAKDRVQLHGVRNEAIFITADKISAQHHTWKNFRTAPYLIMHVHLTGDTLNNKAPYMDV